MIRVVKIGGGVIDDEQLLREILQKLTSQNSPFILVHGGGRIATEIAQALQIPQTMVEGRRITDADTLRVVTMTYAGLINKSIVASLQALGASCLGVCGADMNLITATRRQHETIDYGFVGDVSSVDAENIMRTMRQGISLVIAPITHDGAGQLLNTNADVIACEVAASIAHLVAQHADGDHVELTYLFDLPGVLRDIADPASVIAHIDAERIDELITDGTLTAGMLPKITMARKAVHAGVHVRIQHVRDLGTVNGTLIQ